MTDVLIKENNIKRKQLTEENREYYENMLMYIRLNYSKSNEETEIILQELLDHLLDAQLEGRDAASVFGDNPKAYADEIVAELPKMITKERMNLIVIGVTSFLAVSLLFNAIFELVTYYVTESGGIYETFYTGSLFVYFITSLILGFAFFYLVIKIFKWTCFKSIHNLAEFGIYWLLSVSLIGLFMLVLFFLPDFGPSFTISNWILIILGGVLLLVEFYLLKRT